MQTAASAARAILSLPLRWDFSGRFPAGGRAMRLSPLCGLWHSVHRLEIRVPGLPQREREHVGGAANVAGIHARTRGSLAVQSALADTSCHLRRARTGSSRTALKPASVLTLPNSAMLSGPFAVVSKRRVSDIGIRAMEAANRPGRSSVARPSRMPPAFDPGRPACADWCICDLAAAAPGEQRRAPCPGLFKIYLREPEHAEATRARSA